LPIKKSILARRRGIRILGRAALMTALGMGCGTEPPPPTEGFSAQATESLTSKATRFQVAIRTSPHPPSRGMLSVEYTISSSATGAPASGLALDIVPWMPTMGHGTSTIPSISETAPGVYLATELNLFMPGLWVLRTTIAGAPDDAGDAGPASDYVEPSFDIP
jgi:hypothetical protein